MKWISNTIKSIRYRRLVKRSLEPREAFLEASREVFLAEVAKRRVAPYAPQFAWRTFGIQTIRYSAVFASIALLGTSGLVAYADNRNVSVDSPLYPLKRVGERVRLTVVPATRESELRKEFAQRRASELAEVETKKRSDDDGDVKRLRELETKEKELRAEFRKNIEVIEEHTDERTEKSVVDVVSETGLCQAAKTVERHAENGKSERYKKFEERCRNVLDKEDERDTDSPIATSSAVDDRNADKREEKNERSGDRKKVEDIERIEQE